MEYSTTSIPVSVVLMGLPFPVISIGVQSLTWISWQTVTAVSWLGARQKSPGVDQNYTPKSFVIFRQLSWSMTAVFVLYKFLFMWECLPFPRYVLSASRICCECFCHPPLPKALEMEVLEVLKTSSWWWSVRQRSWKTVTVLAWFAPPADSTSAACHSWTDFADMKCNSLNSNAEYSLTITFFCWQFVWVHTL